MQYQIYQEETNELIAWIDTKTQEGICKKGYAVLKGEDLTVRENWDDLGVARFEKVSEDEYCRAITPDMHIPEYGIIGTNDYLRALKLPRRSTKGSAGYDFFLPYELVIRAGETVLIPTGVKCRMAEGIVLMMYPRSSLGYKYKITLDNTVGIIDSDYYGNPSNEGHIFVRMTNHSTEDCIVPVGKAYCQGVFHRCYLTDDDDASGERVGGHGSTNG